MFRVDGNLIRRLIFGRPLPLPDVVRDDFEELPDPGLTMGTLIIGRQGSGKTSSLASHLVNYFIKYPARAIFVLDWSGAISDTILTLIQHMPKGIRKELEKRIIYDELGNPDWTIPLPEFSTDYGTSSDDQVQRVSLNMEKLEPELVEKAPVVGGVSIKELAPHMFRLLKAIEIEGNATWQITETKRLLTDLNQLRKALKDFGEKEPGSKFYLEHEYLNVKSNERLLRRYAIHSILSAIESKPVRARLGYHRPGWTPAEAIRKGQMVLVDAHRLINQRNAQHYLFTQAYSLIMSEINKRRPGNRKDKPVALVMDEVYSLLSIKGMAQEVGTLAPLYRSRKLELYIVLQSLSQLDRELARQIWNIGNIQCFAVSNFDEAYKLAQQLFRYHSTIERMPARTDIGMPILETDRGEYLKLANQIQRFEHRECIMRRYLSERVMDENIRYIPVTRELPLTPFVESVDELRERLLKKRGVKVSEALKIINNRRIGPTRPPKI